MITTWQIICFGLLVVNVLFAARLFNLFRFDSSSLPWKVVIGATLLLIPLFFGVNIASPEFQSALRKFFVSSILSNPSVVAGLCCFLAATALAMARIWFYSETVIFVADTANDFQVSRLRQGKEALLGTVSLDKPLIKRFAKGEVCFRYFAENFASQDQTVHISGGGFGLNERRIVIDLPLSPIFSLHGFHFYPEDVYGEPSDGPHYSKELEKAVSATAAFTIASSSPIQIRIQNVFLRVLSATTFKQSTFPISEGGGNGVTPVIGWVELKPLPNPYRVLSNVKRNVGKNLDPADFHIRTFSRSGNKFQIAVEIEWMDLRHQDVTKRFTFEESYTLALPEIVEWQDAVGKPKKLRMFFDAVDVYFLYLRFQRAQPDGNFVILVPTPHDDEFGKDAVRQYEQVVRVPENELSYLSQLVGTHSETLESNKIRHFIIVDDNKMIMQNADEFDLAEVISDESRISHLIQTFDELAQRFAKPK